MENFNQIESNLLNKIKNISDRNALDSVKTEIFGKKGVITELFKKIGSLDQSQRKEYASKLNSLKTKVTEILDGAGFNSVWSQDISLWIENPGGFTEMDLEKIGYTICDSTPGIGFYVITFWQSIRGPSGKITNVTCR